MFTRILKPHIIFNFYLQYSQIVVLIKKGYAFEFNMHMTWKRLGVKTILL